MKASVLPVKAGTPPLARTVEPLAAFDFHPLSRVVFGVGALAQLGEVVRDLGGSRVLVVTDPGLEAAGHPRAFRLAMEAVRPGGQVVFLGKVNVNEDVAFRWGSLMGEKQIVRSSYGGGRPRRDFPWLAQQYLEGKLKLDELKDQRQQLLQQIESKQKEWTDKQRTEFEKFRSQSLEILRHKVPTWNEETAKAVKSHALSEGYSDAEISAIADPRHALTLWKAYQYDQLQSKAQATVSQARIAKPTPTNPMPQHVKEKLNYRKALKSAATPEERQRIAKQRIGSIFSR